MTKWIRVMACREGDGIWNVEPPERIDPKSLPISDALKLRLADWMRRWLPELRGGTAALDKFAADGLAIAKALKAELPDYKVSY
jgi:hypothetical protein